MDHRPKYKVSTIKTLRIEKNINLYELGVGNNFIGVGGPLVFVLLSLVD